MQLAWHLLPLHRHHPQVPCDRRRLLQIQGDREPDENQASRLRQRHSTQQKQDAWDYYHMQGDRQNRIRHQGELREVLR